MSANTLINSILGGLGGGGGIGGGLGGGLGDALGGALGGMQGQQPRAGQHQTQNQGQGQGQDIAGHVSRAAGNFPGGTAGAAAAAGLAGLLIGSKSGRKLAKKSMKYGGMAALGAIAFKAWQNHQSGSAGGAPQGSVPPAGPAAGGAFGAGPADGFEPPADTRFLPPPESSEADTLAVALLRAMIAAAKSDGHIDGAEQARIFDAIGNADLDPADKGLLLDELRKPLDPDEIGALAERPEWAAEIYVASLAIIGDPNRDERRYLDRLAGRMDIPSALQDELETQIALAVEAEDPARV